MKKILLTGSAAALCAITMAASVPAMRFVEISNKPVSEEVAKTRKAAAAAAQPQLWKAAKITSYYWGESESGTPEWMLNSSSELEYNIAGQVTVEIHDFGRVEYTYDNEGRCTAETRLYKGENGAFVFTDKTEFAYDNIVKNLVVSEKRYLYENNTWKLQEETRTAITRNSDNNITEIKDQIQRIYETPGWHDNSRVEIGYGADKKANTIKVYEYENNQASLEAELTDIVWEKTNGQIVFFEMDEAEFFLGENRMKSAKAVGAHTYPYAGDIFYNVTYKPNNGGYKIVGTMNGSTYMSQDYTVLDAYGSYKSEDYEIDYDHMDDGTYQPDGAQLDEYTEIFDAYGLQLKNSEISYEDGDKANGISYQNVTTGEVTYDKEHGYPLEYIRKNSYDGAPAQNSERYVYSDYYDVIEAGIEDVVTDGNAPVEYFNLQGVKVENPANGLYIRRQGNAVAKVMVK